MFTPGFKYFNLLAKEESLYKPFIMECLHRLSVLFHRTQSLYSYCLLQGVTRNRTVHWSNIDWCFTFRSHVTCQTEKQSLQNQSAQRQKISLVKYGSHNSSPTYAQHVMRNHMLCCFSNFPTNHSHVGGCMFISLGHGVGVDYACRRLSTTCHSRSNKSDSDTPSKGPSLKDLKENVLTIPNMLTMSRIIMSPAIGYLVLAESYSIACGIFVIVGITDVLDGYIARTFPSQASAFGSFLDPLADKLLVTVLFVTLTMVQLIPWPLTGLVVARDLFLVIAAFYIRFITLSPPRTLTKYFDATTVSAQLKPTTISKLNTAVQLSLVACSLAAPVFGYVDHTALQILWYLTAGTTVASGLTYMFAKNTFKILKKVKDIDR